MLSLAVLPYPLHSLVARSLLLLRALLACSSPARLGLSSLTSANTRCPSSEERQEPTTPQRRRSAAAVSVEILAAHCLLLDTPLGVSLSMKCKFPRCGKKQRKSTLQIKLVNSFRALRASGVSGEGPGGTPCHLPAPLLPTLSTRRSASHAPRSSAKVFGSKSSRIAQSTTLELSSYSRQNPVSPRPGPGHGGQEEQGGGKRRPPAADIAPRQVPVLSYHPYTLGALPTTSQSPTTNTDRHTDAASPASSNRNSGRIL